MKPATTIWLCLIMLAGLGTNLYAQHSGHEAAETERKKLSVMLMVQGAVRAIEHQPIDTRSLHDAINQNKRQHQEQANSRSLSKDHIKKEFNDGLQTRLVDIFKAAGLDDIDPAWCRQTETAALEQGMVLIDRNLAQNFDMTFRTVRSGVVEEQKNKLERFATPETPQDYLRVEERSSELHADLMARSIELYSEPLFSENRDFLSEKIKEIIDEAWRQFDEQRSIVKKSRGVGDGDITVESIRQALLAEIEHFRRKLKNPYKIFPSVQEMVLPASKRIATFKFDQWLASWDYKIPLNDIQNKIAADSVTHREPSKSRQVLLKLFRPAVEEKVFSDYLSGLSANDRQALQRFLQAQPAFGSQMDQAVDKSLGHFADARAKVGRDQFAGYFRDLADGTWKLDNAAVQKRYRMDTKKDNQRIVEKFLAGKRVIAETEALVGQAVTELARKGDIAIKGQMSRADEYRTKAENGDLQLFSGIADTRLSTDQFINGLVSTAVDHVRQSWSGDESADVYPQLFKMVKDKIRKDIKDLIPIELKRRENQRQAEREREAERIRKEEETKRLEEKKQDRSSQASAQEKNEKQEGASAGAGGKDNLPGKGAGEGTGKGTGRGPGGGGGGGNGGGGGGGGGGTGSGSGGGAGLGKDKPDVIIDLDITHKKYVNVSIQFEEKDTLDFSFALDDEDQKYSEKVTPNLIKMEERFKAYLKRKSLEQGKDPIYIFTRVFDAKVPYGIVFGLRERVRKVVIDLKIKEKNIFWYDGLFLKSQKTITPNIRKQSRRIGTD